MLFIDSFKLHRVYSSLGVDNSHLQWAVGPRRWEPAGHSVGFNSKNIPNVGFYAIATLCGGQCMFFFSNVTFFFLPY